jgi:tRNA modification GTPase
MLEADVEIAGVPVTLIDTAGVRDSGNEVEIEGVRRALEAVADAAAVVLLWPADGQRAPTVRDDVPTVRVRSKADLLAGPVRGDAWLRVSAKTGEGLAELEEMLRELVGGGTLEADGEVAIARRHRAGLEVARRELEECCLDTPELAAEHLRWALRAVAELCGEVTDEDVLDRVFSAFCVGK